MKKIMIIFLILLCAYQHGFGQTTVGERFISTDPRQPINPDPNSPITLQNGPVKNGFYWFQTNNQFNHQYFNLEYIDNNITQYKTLQNPYFDGLHYPYGTTDPVFQTDHSDYLPEDGWEVIKVDLGRLADDDEQRKRLSELGYIALYNRYGGIMRFIGALPRASTHSQNIKFNIRLLRPNEATFSSEFINENPNVTVRHKYAFDDVQVSNLLSLHGGVLQPLDQKTKVVSATVITEFPGSKPDDYFFWFDIPMAYDPCICKGKLMLALSYEELDSWNFQANGTLMGNYTQNGSADADCHQDQPGQIVGGLVAIAAGVANPATLFSSAGAISGVLKAAGCALGLSPKDEKALEVFTKVIENVGPIGSALTSIKKSEITAKDDLSNYWTFGTGANLKKASKKDIASALAKTTKYFNSAYNLTTLSQTNTVSSAGGMQHNIQGAIDLTGTVTKGTRNWKDVLWALPGSTWPGLKEEAGLPSGTKILPEYPTYNEALGTFAMLKTPKVVALQHQIKNNYFVPATKPFGKSHWVITTDENKQLISVNLNEDLVYFFNPKLHTDYEKTFIMAQWLYTNNAGNNQASEMVSIDEIREQVFTFEAVQGGILYLKLDVNFFSKDLKADGTMNSHTEIFTIPIENNEDIKAGFPDFKDFTNNKLSDPTIRNLLNPDLPEVQIFNGGTTISGGTHSGADAIIDINQLAGTNDGVIFSEGPILIQNANIGTVGGGKLYIRSKVKVEQGVASIGIIDNVFLEIDDDIYISKWPQKPVDIEFVETLCTNKEVEGIRYQADQYYLEEPEESEKTEQRGPANNNSSNKRSKITNRLAELTLPVNDSWTSENLAIFPNPANHSFQIEAQFKTDISKVVLIDLFGRIIKTWNGYEKTYELPTLANGNYMIKIIADDQAAAFIRKINIIQQ